MQEDNTVKEIISAFAIGCLDRDNFDSVAQYFKVGKLPDLGELGNLQNVISLLPISLKKEVPAENLKTELLEKIDEIYKSIPAEELVQADELFNKLENLDNNTTKIQDDITEHVNQPVEEIQNKVEPNIPKYNPLFEEEHLPKIENSYPQKSSAFFNFFSSKTTAIIGISAVVVSIITLVIMVLLLGSADNKISVLENKLTEVEMLSEQSSSFVKNYQKFIDFINSGDVKTISITDTNGFITSKIFVSKSNNTILIQTINLPKINSNEIYNIWVVKNGNTSFISSFEPNKGSKFTEIDLKSNSELLSADIIKITLDKKDKEPSKDSRAVFYGSFIK